MTTRHIVYALLLVLAFGAGALCGGGIDAPAVAQDTAAERPATNDHPAADADALPSRRNPVVAVVPHVTETHYEMDPFDPDKIRSTKSELKRVLVIRADGAQEIRPATDRL